MVLVRGVQGEESGARIRELGGWRSGMFDGQTNDVSNQRIGNRSQTRLRLLIVRSSNNKLITDTLVTDYLRDKVAFCTGVNLTKRAS